MDVIFKDGVVQVEYQMGTELGICTGIKNDDILAAAEDLQRIFKFTAHNDHINYHDSQHWPFPSSGLMLGCFAKVKDGCSDMVSSNNTPLVLL